jgi:hypothetical protein
MIGSETGRGLLCEYFLIFLLSLTFCHCLVIAGHISARFIDNPLWRGEKPQNRGFDGFAIVPRQMVTDTETPQSRCAQISPTKASCDPHWSIRKRLGHVSFCG